MKSLKKRAYEGLGQFIIVLGILLFLPAWTLHFWQAWMYWLIFSISCILITVYFLKHDPHLIELRLKAGPGGEKEKNQKIIQSITGILFLALIILPGLDHRFLWSHVPTPIVLIADIFVALSFYIIFLVFRINSYTSAIIETGKNQKVITTGPYSIVRHPMYSGALFLMIGTPLALGSFWDLIIGILLCLMMAIRLLDEEKFLLKNLKGYKDYCHKTTYHLIPFIW
jgi:protein-S-isoprenylcysteine O-methyltransferase Ste14